MALHTFKIALEATELCDSGCCCRCSAVLKAAGKRLCSGSGEKAQSDEPWLRQLGRNETSLWEMTTSVMKFLVSSLSARLNWKVLTSGLLGSTQSPYRNSQELASCRRRPGQKMPTLRTNH